MPNAGWHRDVLPAVTSGKSASDSFGIARMVIAAAMRNWTLQLAWQVACR
jgi:hypothetical protein